MTQQKQTLKKQRGEQSTARKNSYIKYIEKYPLYSTLLVLKEYEDSELYEECAIIRDAITDYKEKYKKTLPTDLDIPTHVEQYLGDSHQNMMQRENMVVEEKVALEKATLIKLNLPIKNGL